MITDPKEGQDPGDEHEDPCPRHEEAEDHGAGRFAAYIGGKYVIVHGEEL